MSNLSKIVILAAGLGIGYVIEPNIFPRSEEKVNTPASAETVDTEPDPIDEPQTKIDLDLTKLIPSDFPEKITINTPHSISDAASGVKMDLPKGTLVKPVSIKGNNIVIQPIGIPINSEIDADDTNFKQLALPKLIDRLTKGPATVKAPEKPAPTPTPAPVVPAEPTISVETPAEVPAVDPAANVAEMTPPTETPPVSNGSAISDEEIIAAMKAHLAAGGVKEFTADQAISWEIGKEETVNGSTYKQSGRVKFTAQTILGKQTHGAIALIKDGKIEKWVWAKNMLEMR